MQGIVHQLDRLYNVCHIPMALLDAKGEILESWPRSKTEGVLPFAYKAVGEDFRLQKRDAQHPLISFIGSGFLLGVMEITPELYITTGLIPSHVPSRKEILTMLTGYIYPQQLQSFCDFLLQTPMMTPHQLKDYICLVVKLLTEQDIPADNILFMDILTSQTAQAFPLEKNLFEQREEPEFHVPVDFETGICRAIEEGHRFRLEQCIYSPVQGRVGRMSSSELRQHKYSSICMATLASRAAIRGGLPSETAFSLSDLYCQRIDLLSEIEHIQNLTFTMLVDYCDRVRDIQKRPAVSPVIENCISYISVHLHETISLEQLSEHCGLCTRSLSLRFKKEVGMGIPDYIHWEKMQEAKYLLLHSGYSISEITSFLNYPSQSYFTQIFKKHYDMTPQQYRNKHG